MWSFYMKLLVLKTDFINFLPYRKFLRMSEKVYNGIKIKNDKTKEQMRVIRHDVAYEGSCFGLGVAVLFEHEERIIMAWIDP